MKELKKTLIDYVYHISYRLQHATRMIHKLNICALHGRYIALLYTTLNLLCTPFTANDIELVVSYV